MNPATNRLSPTRIGTDSNWVSLSAGLFHSLAVTTNGTLWAWGRGGSGQLGAGLHDQFSHAHPHWHGHELGFC